MKVKSRKSSHNHQVASDRIFIGVAGGSAAGKTTLCETINRQMAFDRNFKVQTISLDSFYKSIDKTVIDVAEYNFDHPLALDFDLAYQILQKLKYSNDPVEVPQYCFVEHQRKKESTKAYPANIILFEGLMAFYDERIRNMMTYKIFINCDDDIRLCRRIKRDTTQRGRTIEGVLMQYNKFVKNAFRDFIYPTINYADLVIPGSRNNRISVDFIVEHIKNVARKKNIFKTAQETKVFLFGESQYFDMNVKKNYKDSIELQRESFLIFPTSDEHRRELDFFLNSLMSSAFTQEYFEEVYIYQFMKAIRSLLRQLFQLKNINTNDMELISIYQLRQKLKKKSSKPIKIIFVPIIFQKQQQFLHYVKPLLKPKQTVIIINLFCDMPYPTKIYEQDIEGLVFINLFLVANKKRLLDILCANNLNVTKNKEELKYPRDWLLHNKHLIEKGIMFIANEFKIQYQRMDWKLQEELLQEQVQKLKLKNKEELFTYPIFDEPNPDNKMIWVDQAKNRRIEQVSVLPQAHPNLCGFYALHNIKQYPNLKLMRAKEQFIENYMEFNLLLERKGDGIKNLKKELFEPLQRHDANYIINEPELFGEKQIVPLFMSQNYILNDKGSLKDLSKSLVKLKNYYIHELYLLMGVFNHFFVLRLHGLNDQEDHKVQYMDSINTPIKEIMNGICSLPNPTHQDMKKIQNMKTAIETALELYYTDVSIQTMLVRLRINQILGSYYKFKEANNLGSWIENEYPSQVIHNDLFTELREVSEDELGEEYVNRLKSWFDEDFVKQHVEKPDTDHHPLKRFRSKN